jgi:hypothetical protein
MKKKWTILATLLASVCLLFACGKTESPSTDSSTGNPTDSSVEGGSSEEKPEEKPEENGGRLDGDNDLVWG